MDLDNKYKRNTVRHYLYIGSLKYYKCQNHRNREKKSRYYCLDVGKNGKIGKKKCMLSSKGNKVWESNMKYDILC